MKMTSLLWRHVHIECSQLEQYFAHSFTTCQVLNTIASYEYQKNECIQQWNRFKCQTSTFYFSTYCPNLFEHLLIHASQTVWEIAAIAGSVVETARQPGLFSSTTLSHPQANFLHQHCIAGLVKHLSPYIWTHLRVNGIWATSFCQEKMNNRMLFLTGCLQR